MADELRDTDGWLNNNDTGSPESSPVPQAEAPQSYCAAHQDDQGDADANAQSDRSQDHPQDFLSRKNTPEIGSERVVSVSRHQSKISPEFGARLEHLKPGQKIRAVVMLETSHPGGGERLCSLPSAPTRRQTLEERKAAIARIQNAAQRSLEEIRPILEAFHANLLAPSPDAVGAVPVEIDAAGIPALAQSNRVRTILEDQAVRPIDGSRVRRPYSSPFSH
ncbi:MAG: hypothetical protein SNJ57_10315 [Cyanobacteriota bacterium]